MSTGDAEKLPTPYVRYFGQGQTAWEDHFKAVGVEARERGLEPASPESFARLAQSRAALKHLLTGAESPEVRVRLGALLYQAWHFRRAGEKVYTVSREMASDLVARGPEQAWHLDDERHAGFVRLPDRYFAAPGSGGGRGCWMDGFFWTQGVGQLVLLPVLSEAHGDFTLLPLPAFPVSVAGHLARETIRDSGDDFAAVGGEEAPYAVSSAAEILKLAVRVLWRLHGEPGAATDEDGPAAGEETPDG